MMRGLLAASGGGYVCFLFIAASANLAELRRTVNIVIGLYDDEDWCRLCRVGR